jgi:lipopolysaccharide transport system ATP-binding protein
MDSEATGIENIFLRGALLGFNRTWLSAKVKEIVDFAGLGNFIEMPLRTYSTGMQMRLAFSIATLQQPEILVMDEWLTVGDADFQEKAQQQLKEIVQKSSILVIGIIQWAKKNITIRMAKVQTRMRNSIDKINIMIVVSHVHKL